jgi:hypothetical protein
MERERAVAAAEPPAGAWRKNVTGWELTLRLLRAAPLEKYFGLGPSIGLDPFTFFFPKCEISHRYVTYLLSFGLWYEYIKTIGWSKIDGCNSSGGTIKEP